MSSINENIIRETCLECQNQMYYLLNEKKNKKKQNSSPESFFPTWPDALKEILINLPNEYYLNKRAASGAEATTDSFLTSSFNENLFPSSNLLIFRGSYWYFVFLKLLQKYPGKIANEFTTKFLIYIKKIDFQNNIYICLENLNIFLNKEKETELVRSNLTASKQIGKWIIENYSYVDITKTPYYIINKIKQYYLNYPFLLKMNEEIKTVSIPSLVQEKVLRNRQEDTTWKKQEKEEKEEELENKSNSSLLPLRTKANSSFLFFYIWVERVIIYFVFYLFHSLIIQFIYMILLLSLIFFHSLLNII